MRPVDLIRLIVLAAIWGASFVLLRVLVPVIGPVTTATLRVLVAGVALSIYCKITGLDVEWRRFWKEYVFVGAINSGFPFLLYAWAALYMPACYLVIVNSTSPLFGAIFSAIWLGERLTIWKLAGILVGAAGVALVARVPPPDLNPMFGLALFVSLLAPLCYALSSIYIKKSQVSAKPTALAGASQLAAGILLLPLLPLAPPEGTFTLPVVLNILCLGLLCSGVAYFLYYRLLVDVGPTKALMVTFLIPAFGMLWGFVFLSEHVTVAMIAGCALIVAGTALVLKSPRRDSQLATRPLDPAR
jgi:drug/metabolite transporter (DMT)-like permease